MRRIFTILWTLILTFVFVSPLNYAQNKNSQTEVKQIKRLINKYLTGETLTREEKEIFQSLDPSLYRASSVNEEKNSFAVRNFIGITKGEKGVIDESFETWTPSGWTLDPASGTGAWLQDDGSDHGPGSCYDGSSAAMFNNYDYSSGTKGSIITPQFDVSTYSNPQLSFYWWNDDGSSSPATLTIYTSTDGSSYTEVETIDTYGSGASTWVHYTHSIGTDVKYIKIEATSDYGYKNTFIDKFEVYEGPTSPVFSIDPSSKDFGTVNLGESSSAQTFTITNTGGGTLTISSAPTITGTNTGDFSISDANTYPKDLAASESITLDVTFSPQAEGSRSANLHIVANAKTDHDIALTGTGHNPVLTPPFTEDFSTYVPTDWSESEGTLADPTTLSGTTSYWVQDDYRNDTGDSNGKSAKINIYGTSRKEWLITPPIDLGDGSTHYQLEFDLALTDYGNTGDPDQNGDDDKFAVVISTDNGATWTSANTLKLWDNTTSPTYSEIPAAGEHITINLTSYTGKVKIGFYGESTTSNADNDLFVDNVQVREVPTTPIFTVSPESHDFGTVFLGESSSSQTFTVTNTGEGTLEITATTITGTNPGDFTLTDGNTYPVDLANGESMSVSVVFSPAADGARSATLRFTSNVKTDHDVALTGTGHDATVSSYPYNEPFTNFTASDDATGFADDWRTDPANTTSAFRWNPDKGGTPSSSTGPAVDHTSGDADGMYLFTEASSGSEGSLAYVYSPPFDLTSLTDPAVKFYYHMYGAAMGTLALDISTDNGSTWTNLFSKTGQQQSSDTDVWLPYYTELAAYAGQTVRFRFKATRGDSYTSDMAIDDFYVGEKLNKTLNSITVDQASTDNVLIGSVNKEILKLTFSVEAGSGNLPLNSITVTGSNTNDNDITSVKLYRTTTATFATDDLVASGSFAKGSVAFSGINYDLPVGNTYFWIAYDISSSAAVGNIADAKILANGIDVNGTTYNSSDDDPTGSRTISGIALSAVTVTQASTSDVTVGSSDNEILRIFLDTEESTTSGGTSVNFTKLDVTTKNSDDADVGAVKLYKTTGTTFNTDNLVASGTIGKGSVTFDITESLTADAYYWVTYDVSSNAADGNTVDALIPSNGMTISGTTYNTDADDPAGERHIKNYNHGGNGTAYGGYYFANSTADGGDNRPTYGWIDPVAGGHTQITSWTDDGDTGGDDSYLKIDIPFSFPFFGSNYDTVYINTNGAISFSSASAAATGATLSIPSTTEPNNLIAVFMADLDNNPTGFTTEGKVYYGTTDGNFVVTWLNYYDYNDANEYVSCQVILKSNGNIKLQYNPAMSSFSGDLDDDALIGIENAAGTDGHQYRNNGTGGPIFDGAKASGLAVEYSTDESATPVELTSFVAVPDNDGIVELKWATATEVNTAMFEVERSVAVENEEPEWETIANVKASGNSNSPKEYSFEDELSRSGKYNYRLKIVDMDGQFEYSNIVEVTANIVLKYELSQNYPNPFNPTTTIKYSIKKSGKVKITLYNALGQEVAELVNKAQEAGKYKVQFNASRLSSGVYFYRIQSGDFVAVKKMMLLK